MGKTAYVVSNFVISKSAVTHLQALNLWFVTDGETFVLVSATDEDAALHEGTKTKRLDRNTVHWVL